MRGKSATVSLREIANETNLSITTVSRVLRKQGEISDQTRDKVLKTAKRLRYRPNMLVQGIRTGKTHTIGVMVPPYDSYWVNVLNGIHDELTSEDHVFINAWCNHTNGDCSYSDMLLDQLHRLIDRRVDGIILWAHLAPLYNEYVVEELEARNLPVVTIDHELPFADSVETDEKLGASLAAGHLLELGHRNIAHLGWDQSYKWAQLRRTYFEKEIAEAGAKCTTVCTENDDDVPSITKRLLSENPDITAIYSCSDRVAKLIHETLLSENIRIPEDISLVGFADLEFSKWTGPPLTTIKQNGIEAGHSAAKLLISRSRGDVREADPRRVKIKCELIVRGSTGKANCELL